MNFTCLRRLQRRNATDATGCSVQAATAAPRASVARCSADPGAPRATSLFRQINPTDPKNPTNCSLAQFGPGHKKMITFWGYDSKWTNKGNQKVKSSFRFGQVRFSDRKSIPGISIKKTSGTLVLLVEFKGQLLLKQKLCRSSAAPFKLKPRKRDPKRGQCPEV